MHIYFTALHRTTLTCICSVLHCSNVEMRFLGVIDFEGDFWKFYRMFSKLTFEMHDSTELGLLRVLENTTEQTFETL